MRPSAIIVVALSVLVAAQAAGAAELGRQSRRQAEINILRTPRLLERWRPELVDPKTSLVRSNTVVRCTRRGHAADGRSHRFDCTIRGGVWRVTLKYLSLPDHHFRAKRFRVFRVSS